METGMVVPTHNPGTEGRNGRIVSGRPSMLHSMVKAILSDVVRHWLKKTQG